MGYIQLQLFQPKEEIKQAWYIGLPCKEMWYFDLIKRGCEIQDCSKPWEIEDYQKNTEWNTNNNI